MAWTIEKTGLIEAGKTPGNHAIFQSDIAVIAGVAIKYALSLIGVIFLALIVYAGVLWMTAQGDEKKIGTARGFIFHSILGLMIVMAAYALTSYLITYLGGAALQ